MKPAPGDCRSAAAAPPSGGKPAQRDAFPGACPHCIDIVLDGVMETMFDVYRAGLASAQQDAGDEAGK